MSSNGSHTKQYYTICRPLPPRVNTETIWKKTGSLCNIPTSALPMFEMQMCMIFFITVFFHNFLRRLGIPKMTSMSIAGLIIGTTLNDKWKDTRDKLFTIESQESLGLLSSLAYGLFLFYIGVKTDMSMVQNTRKSAISIGTSALLAPFICGLATVFFHSSNYVHGSSGRKQLVVITGMLSITPFPVISSVLNDLKILNSELGRLGLSSALVSEILSITLTSIGASSRTYEEHGPLRTVINTLAAICLVLSLVYIIRPAMFWVIKQTPEGSPVSDDCVYLVLIIALLSSYASYCFGFAPLFAPYMLGLAVPEGPPLGTAIIKKIDTFLNGVLMPLFATTCAMRVDIRYFFTDEAKVHGKVDPLLTQTMVLVVVTFVAKFVACMLPPLFRKMPLTDALSVALIMSCKGVVDMAAYSFTRYVIGMSDCVFALLMISMIVIATVVPMLLNYLYDPMKKFAGYTKRNIMDLKSNSDLRVLTCIYTPANIPPIINLLEATYPTKEEPLCAFAVQLIELIGRASPVFVCHKLQKKRADQNSSMSQHLIDAFENFEMEFKGALEVVTFTSVSPAEMMYDDICTLALDKHTALIVLPFHRKWSSNGNSIEFEDESLRDLNSCVMERAPCSVGILIERAQITHIFSPETPYTVCLLFIGGKDDREALFFAKRMAKNPNVRLTVVRLLASESEAMIDEMEVNLDNRLLNDIRIKNVDYVEAVVKDGPETALFIRPLVTQYDLIIVGRQAGRETPQTCGLLQWSEFPELGALGDLLGSTDAAGKASVFVIQQQRTAMDF